MGIHLTGIVILAGNYGSGKTEVAINLAVMSKNAGTDVRVADLDLVNPYFRTRESKGVLADMGIEVVLPPDEYMHADLPILTPAIAGMIRQPSPLTLLDVGGDDVGATVLAALTNVLDLKEVQMLQVINPFRPNTDTIEGCLRIRDEIETASKRKITGIVGNANLINETTSDIIYQGHDFVNQVAYASGLNLEFITVPADLIEQVDMPYFSCPVLPVARQLVPPWIEPKSFVNSTQQPGS